LSRRGIVLEAYDDGSYTLAKFEKIPPEIRGSSLVLVAARITRVTRRQLARHQRTLADSPRGTTGPSRGRVPR
jgi:hypothetical protein